jgi:hypothetical protein
MRFLYELAAAVPALAAGLTVGHVVASLDAPAPWPQFAALAVALAVAHVLDGLINTLLAYRAARRG